MAQRTPRHEADSQFLTCGQHFRFGISRPNGVFVLDGSERLDGVRATDGFGACLGEAKVPDLSLLHQVFDRARDVLDRHVRIYPVLVEKIDDIGPQSLE